MSSRIYLPALYLPQMSDGTITQNELDGVGNAIAMVLELYAEAAPTDYYEFFFSDETEPFAVRIYDPNNNHFDFPFTVYKDATNIPDGRYLVYYRVKEPSGNSLMSPYSEVFLDRNGTFFAYKPPVFPGAVNGVLPEPEYVSQVRVNVSYDSMKSGDQITLTLTGINESGLPSANSETSYHVVNDTDIINNNRTVNFILSNQIPQEINNSGILEASYGGILGGLPGKFSPPARVSLGSGMLLLAPPVFVDARDGALSIAEVTTQGSSPLKASYTAMAVGDRVTFTVSGKNAAGQPVAGADWISLTVTVQVSDITNGRYDVAVAVPSNVLLPVGENGRIRATYEVQRINGGGISSSLPTEIIMTASAKIISGVQISTGSPFRATGVSTKACNRGVVYATPGSDVELHASPLSGGAQPLLTWVNKSGNSISNSADIISTRTDILGRAYFTAYVDDAYGFCQVRATIQDMGSSGADRLIVDTDIEFSRYLQGNRFMSYRSSTQAPADGVVRNTIYVIPSSEEIQSDVIRVEITGSATARLVGASQTDPAELTGFYVLNADKSVAIDVIDTEANNPNLEIHLSLPSDNDSALTVSGIHGMIFVTPLNL